MWKTETNTQRCQQAGGYIYIYMYIYTANINKEMIALWKICLQYSLIRTEDREQLAFTLCNMNNMCLKATLAQLCLTFGEVLISF